LHVVLTEVDIAHTGMSTEQNNFTSSCVLSSGVGNKKGRTIFLPR